MKWFQCWKRKSLKKVLFQAGAFYNLFSAILLVFANKQDMEGAMSPTEVAKELGLAALRSVFVHTFNFQPFFLEKESGKSSRPPP